MGEQLPGGGFFGWLGRQIGHVKTAVKHDPVKGVATKPTTPKPLPAESVKPRETVKPRESVKPPMSPEPPAAPKILYRTDQVEELPHPTNPELKLRRTVIDEVIVDKKKES